MLLLAVSEAAMLKSSYSCLAINTDIHPHHSIWHYKYFGHGQAPNRAPSRPSIYSPREAFLVHQLDVAGLKVRGILAMAWAAIQPALLDCISHMTIVVDVSMLQP